MTAVCTVQGDLFTCGDGSNGRLAMEGKTLRLVCPEAGGREEKGRCIGRTGRSDALSSMDRGRELFTVGYGFLGQLGHGGTHDAHVYVPRLVDALAGKNSNVVGSAAGERHVVVWADAVELFAFGIGFHGQLGHGGTHDERVSKLVEAQ